MSNHVIRIKNNQDLYVRSFEIAPRFSVRYTADVDDALRFARKKDADDVIKAMSKVEYSSPKEAVPHESCVRAFIFRLSEMLGRCKISNR